MRYRYSQEAQHILQRVEQENLKVYSHTSNSNQNQVVPQTMQLGFEGRNLIQIIIPRGEEEILPPIDMVDIIQLKTGRFIETKATANLPFTTLLW